MEKCSVGKLVATGAISCGVLVLALPITIIVDNFMKVNEEEEEEGSHRLRRIGPRNSFTIEVPLERFVQQQQMKLKGLIRKESNRYLGSNKQQTFVRNNNNNINDDSNDNDNDNSNNDCMNHQLLVMNQ
uniref:Col_cuticle_N domain-containing protein n=1 Tax=Loa loa TaxID=7209 RepID=A0A1I7VCI2_LOALO